MASYSLWQASHPPRWARTSSDSSWEKSSSMNRGSSSKTFRHGRCRVDRPRAFLRYGAYRKSLELLHEDLPGPENPFFTVPKRQSRDLGHLLVGPEGEVPQDDQLPVVGGQVVHGPLDILQDRLIVYTHPGG